MPTKIRINEHFIELENRNPDEEFAEFIRQHKRLYKTRRRGIYNVSIHLLPEVLEHFRKITSASQLPDSIKPLYIEELSRRMPTAQLKREGPSETDLLLWPHQCLGVELARYNRRYNFFYDTRTGKTLMMLRIIRERLQQRSIKRALVICPASIVRAWESDAKKYVPELKTVLYYGTVAEREAALRKPAHIIIWPTSQVIANLAFIKSVKFDMCVLDESSDIKNPRSKISDALLELSITIPSWYNLSATPAPNGMHEYYTQMRCIDPCAFSETRGHFEDYYFENKSRVKEYKKLVIRPDKQEELQSIVDQYSVYVDQGVMPTAGKEWHIVNFTMNKEEENYYHIMKTKMLIEVTQLETERKKVTAEFAASLRSKLNQITSGFIISTEAKHENAISRKLGEPMQEDTFRLAITGDSRGSRCKALEDLLRTLNPSKCVIWANYREEFDIIRELLGDSAGYINGDTDYRERDKLIYDAFKCGTLTYLVCHPKSVGMGINLTEASTAIYYSLNDSWEALKQSSERIAGHITVQPNKCHYYVLIASGTVNDLIYNNLINKRDVSIGFLEYLKAGK